VRARSGGASAGRNFLLYDATISAHLRNSFNFPIDALYYGVGIILSPHRGVPW